MADVARVRGLPLTVPVPFVALDDEAFRRAAHGALRRANGEEAKKEAGPDYLDHFAQAFTMGSGDTVRRGAGAIYDAELGGFYDLATKRMYLRGAASTADMLTRGILEHETEHALQDRAFSQPDPSALSLDESLATRALYEGDATLTMAVVEAARGGIPPAIAIANVARAHATMSVEAMLKKSTAEVRQAPPIIREEILWPYSGGTEFVTALANAGGWALVNAAFAHPPTTTEQVLHVEKYLAGEQAVSVSVPAIPPGYRGVSRGSMGELVTRVFLQQCASDLEARQASRGWGGDSFAIVSKDEAQSLLWITAWDDALSAARFARALEQRRECTRTGPKPDLTVVREGSRVAFVQGMEGPFERQREAEALFPLVGDAPAALPPFGSQAVKLRPVPPVQEDFTARGRVEGGWFVDEAIGVRAPVVGMSVTRDPAVDLSANREGLRVIVGTLWSPPSEALANTVVAEFVKGLRGARSKNGQGETFIYEGRPTRATLSWTTAMERDLRVPGVVEEQLVLAPMCSGKMTLLLMVSRGPDADRDEADRWLASVQATASSPACEALKSLRDPEEK